MSYLNGAMLSWALVIHSCLFINIILTTSQYWRIKLCHKYDKPLFEPKIAQNISHASPGISELKDILWDTLGIHTSPLEKYPDFYVITSTYVIKPTYRIVMNVTMRLREKVDRGLCELVWVIVCSRWQSMPTVHTSFWTCRVAKMLCKGVILRFTNISAKKIA